ncbi:MAG: ABC transporter permease [Sulfuritalea sp.]|nr:ABC transporter permease [Sulfuritalea sp.]
MKVWLLHHRDAALLAWRRLFVVPLNSLLFVIAIGVALALPAGGQMLLANARQLTGAVSATPQISIFMAANADRAAANEIGSRLGKAAGVRHARFVPREDTLSRMKANPGLRDAIEVLPGNPFPDAFVVSVDDERPESMERLAAEFRRWAGVEHVQLDSAWVRRLEALIGLGRNAVILLGALLGAGLVAICFSIIRMQVLVHRAEIEVSGLLGATENFVRRPFIYHGVLLGLGGGIVALLIVTAATLWLRAPLGDLARLYDLTLNLQPLGAIDSALLLAAAGGLGWLGATISLGQHLDR